MSSTTTATATRTRVIEVVVNTCACSTIHATVGDVKLPKKVAKFVTDGVLSTGCEAETLSIWAPGHDARAVSILSALKRAGIEDGVTYNEVAITPALQAKIDYVPTAKERPLTAIRLADGTEVEARIGRDGKARTESGDVHNPGTFLLA
jgi:hypothetical protein